MAVESLGEAGYLVGAITGAWATIKLIGGGGRMILPNINGRVGAVLRKAAGDDDGKDRLAEALSNIYTHVKDTETSVREIRGVTCGHDGIAAQQRAMTLLLDKTSARLDNLGARLEDVGHVHSGQITALAQINGKLDSLTK